MEPIKKDIQQGYDKVAAAYAQQFINEQDTKPMDQQMLHRFADEVRGRGRVCDMGCGPGQVGAWLYDHCDLKEITGIDLSPNFIEEAKKLHPELEFQQGDMLHLDLPDESFAGITAFYCLIHIPHDEIVDVLKELKRVLIPGGVLLLTFHLGTEPYLSKEAWGQEISMVYNFFQPEEFEGYLRAAGYERIESTVREPYDVKIEYQSQRAYIFARKPVD
jgi:ubiquinone/menaquinone biosynthesis C-methylase UbiE